MFGRYIHRNTGVEYDIAALGKLRKPDGEWVECVVYRNDKGEVFVRETQDFLDSFDYKK
jgi:hypothetical protein